jgi:hypothetical protein
MKLNILRLLVVALACTSALMLLTNARAQKTQTPAATVAPKEKTVDQTGKNIQVLKGLPESQLGTVMNYIAVSMGRRCDFCHVNKGGTWSWESDEKEEKLAARKMITMVLAINKDNFRGSPTVGCYTCHRGRSTPQGLPSFPLPTPAPRPQPQATPAAGQAAATPAPTPPQPTADQILGKYTEALGGQAAIDKMKTLVMKGTYAGFNGTALPYEVALAAPDKFYINVTAQQGTVERGFDGKAGWEKGPRGVNELMNPVLDDLKSTLLFYRNIKLKEQFTRFRGSRKDKIGDRDVIVLNGTTTDNRREQLFFDAETGLLRRRISYVETPIGVIPSQIDFDDYRDVEGVKLPFMVKVSSVEPGLVSTRTYTEIKLNAAVDDARFKMPAAPAKP